ncbi:MAG: hypothetical protein MUP70_10715, partial [Candidatus Aminicenantes bacterium]|nr:hypothetical protein [Candidatus Aminicenantes bacterium]
MKIRKILAGCVLCFLLAVGMDARAGEDFDFYGTWRLIRDQSAEIGLYNTLSIVISGDQDNLCLEQKWGTQRNLTDKLALRVDGSVNRIPIMDRVFPSNVFMGISRAVGEDRRIRAEWGPGGKTLKLMETCPVLVSQGKKEIEALHTYTLSDNGGRMIYTIERSSRENGGAVRFVLQREEYRHAHVMQLADDWSLDGKLTEQAFLISLQGTVNRKGPRLYYIYPKSWDFTYTGAVHDFYKDSKDYLFTELRTPRQALQVFKDD